MNNQIEIVRAYLQSVRAAVQDIAVYGRLYVFDQVILGLLSKSFSISDAALTLIENEHPEEAYGLSRSLVECALNLRFLTQDEDRAEREIRAWKFARFFYKEKQYWLYQAKQWITDASLIAEMDKFAAENSIAADPKAASNHWSGVAGFTWHCVNLDHPLDGQTYDLKSRKIAYAVDYHATSAYVHGSHDAIEHLLPFTRSVYAPLLRLSDDDGQAGQKTLYIVVQYSHLSTRYAMFGMEVEKTQFIDEEYRRALAALEPVRARHKPESVYRRIF